MNLVYIVDVSYSMWDSLPKLRQDIKNGLALNLNASDTLTVMWFSGKGEYGNVLFNYNIETIKDVNQVNNALETWLKPVGATCFEDVLKSLVDSIDYLPDDETSVYFLTDGYDNQSSKGNIINHCKQLGLKVDNFNILEYGHYCNTKLLKEMNESVNGNHHFTETYSSLAKFFSGDQFTKTIEHPMVSGDLLCYIKDGTIYKSKNNRYPQGSTPLVYNEKSNSAVSNYLRFYFSEDVYSIAKLLSDVDIMDRSHDAITYQEKLDLKEYIKDCIINDRYYNKGINHQHKVKEAKTLLEFLENLQGYLCVDHPSFEYNRIGKVSKVKEDDMIQRLVEEMKTTSDPVRIREIAYDITSYKDYVPKFIPFDRYRKMKITGVDFSETMCNVNISTTCDGVVFLPETDERKDLGLPETISTFINRKYNIIKNGVVNNRVLPLLVTDDLIKYLSEFDNVSYRVVPYGDDSVAMVDVSRMKLLSNAISNERNYAEVQEGLQTEKAKYKVLRHLVGKFNPLRKSKLFTEQYGEEAAKFLSEIGVRDYGWSPKTTTDKDKKDYYVQHEMKYAIRGLSSLPSIDAVIKASKKYDTYVDALDGLTLSQALIYKIYKEHEKLTELELEECLKTIEKNKKLLSMEASTNSYHLLLTQPDDYTDTVKIELVGREVPMKVSKNEKLVYI